MNRNRACVRGLWSVNRVKEPDVTNSRVGSQEFSVKGREVGLGSGEFPGVESQRVPGATEVLLEHGAQVGVGGINSKRDGGTRFRVSKDRNGGKEKLGEDWGPRKRFTWTFKGVG